MQEKFADRLDQPVGPSQMRDLRQRRVLSIVGFRNETTYNDQDFLGKADSQSIKSSQSAYHFKET